jgi:hypothetical protein
LPVSYASLDTDRLTLRLKNRHQAGGMCMGEIGAT